MLARSITTSQITSRQEVIGPKWRKSVITFKLVKSKTVNLDTVVCDGPNLNPTVLVLTKTHKLYFILDVISNKQVRFVFFKVRKKAGLAAQKAETETRRQRGWVGGWGVVLAAQTSRAPLAVHDDEATPPHREACITRKLAAAAKQSNKKEKRSQSRRC